MLLNPFTSRTVSGAVALFLAIYTTSTTVKYSKTSIVTVLLNPFTSRTVSGAVALYYCQIFKDIVSTLQIAASSRELIGTDRYLLCLVNFCADNSDRGSAE
jgi:hypothetical protein